MHPDAIKYFQDGYIIHKKLYSKQVFVFLPYQLVPSFINAYIEHPLCLSLL